MVYHVSSSCSLLLGLKGCTRDRVTLVVDYFITYEENRLGE